MSMPMLMPQAAAEAGSRYAPLDGYHQASTVLFAGGRRTLLADGPALDLAAADVPALAGAVASFQHATDALVAGAVTFDGRASALRACSGPRWGARLPVNRCMRCGHQWSVEHDTAPEDYRKAVEVARDRIRAGDLRKVVLARSLRMTSARPMSSLEVLTHLGGRGRYVFAVPLPGERLLIGASPELLVQRRGLRVNANPLAGSVPRSPDPIEDRALAAQLLESSKDLHEHRVVVEAVAAALRPYCRDLHVPPPEVVATSTVWHLSTPISGELRDPAPSALELAGALHPTPAVCGSPTDTAAALITELEEAERGFYAGLVGWQNSTGDGTWALTLRCAELLDRRQLRLWAGAGIVADSDPDTELAETSAKFATLLQALGYRGSAQ
ncbi:isochorismate synthase [Nonomuraea sp. NPDC050556]|uniref:isochorismate synthase n=1 Tax=Nonomuraea sp. NPDC050556 TaxID=3364369 RepID=UPI003788B573